MRIPGTGVNGAIDGEPVPRVANTTNIWFDQLEGEALVIALDLKGVSISGGTGSKEIWAMDYDGQNQHQISHLGTISPLSAHLTR